MSEGVLFPRLESVIASEKRRDLLEGGSRAAYVNESELADLLARPRAFPPTGGRAIALDELIQFRAQCNQVLEDSSSLSSREFNKVVDLELGRLLFTLGQYSIGEFGQPQVWDFLTLALLPDVAIRRISSDDGSERTSDRSFDKLTGGSRRHVLQRLWKRWLVFGAETVCSQQLTEDDYGGMLERRLTLERHGVAAMAAKAILTSGYTQSKRREFARAFLRNLIAFSGVVDMSESDPGNLSDICEYLKAQTDAMM